MEGIELKASENGDKWVLNGTKLFVPNAHVSDYIVVAARTGDGANDISLFIVSTQAKGVEETLLQTIASDRQSEVIFNNVEVSSADLLGEKNTGWSTIEKVLQWGAIGKCAEMTGGGQEVLDMTVEYAKQRTQFGRPIGSFQAVQHNLAMLAGEAAAASSAADAAVRAIEQHGLDDPRTRIAVASAKVRSGEAAGAGAAIAHQVHGAMGYTHEYSLQHYTRRLWSWRDDFGSESVWAVQLGNQVSAAGYQSLWPVLWDF